MTYTTNQLQDEFGIMAPETITRLVKIGTLKPKRVNRRYVFSEADREALAQYVESVRGNGRCKFGQQSSRQENAKLEVLLAARKAKAQMLERMETADPATRKRIETLTIPGLDRAIAEAEAELGHLDTIGKYKQAKQQAEWRKSVEYAQKLRAEGYSVRQMPMSWSALLHRAKILGMELR